VFQLCSAARRAQALRPSCCDRHHHALRCPEPRVAHAAVHAAFRHDRPAGCVKPGARLAEPTGYSRGAHRVLTGYTACGRSRSGTPAHWLAARSVRSSKTSCAPSRPATPPGMQCRVIPQLRPGSMLAVCRAVRVHSCVYAAARCQVHGMLLRRDADVEAAGRLLHVTPPLLCALLCASRRHAAAAEHPRIVLLRRNAAWSHNRHTHGP